jgi:SAC3/GANP family
MQASELYDQGIQGRKHEFMMYRTLYLALNSEKSVLLRYLKELTPEDLQTEPMKQVLKLIKNLVVGNFAYIFNQLEKGKEGTKTLLRMFLLKLRVWALQMIAKSFSKTISFEKLTFALKFDDQD